MARRSFQSVLVADRECDRRHAGSNAAGDALPQRWATVTGRGEALLHRSDRGGDDGSPPGSAVRGLVPPAPNSSRSCGRRSAAQELRASRSAAMLDDRSKRPHVRGAVHWEEIRDGFTPRQLIHCSTAAGSAETRPMATGPHMPTLNRVSSRIARSAIPIHACLV